MTQATTATVHLKPARPGLIVRDPLSGQPLRPEGEAKPLASYWRRRLRDGDVIKATPPRAPSAKAAPDKK